MKKIFLNGVFSWIKTNLVCISLVMLFVILYLITSNIPTLFSKLATCDIKYMNNEYYRWITAIFLHFNFEHLFFNSLAILAVGSLISPFIGRVKTLLIFVLCGVLAEVVYSFIVNNGMGNYGAGSSGGIFSLIAALMVCYLRYPNAFPKKWYRFDIIIVVLFFVFANDNIGSFMTHLFGFAIGIITCFLMVQFRLIKTKV
ncbi:MAG: rhomboid family intramembrane serine protease [Ruminococcus sp.]|nr:rhomboid family intramembrane serine protease [Ruminococcus sp.]